MSSCAKRAGCGRAERRRRVRDVCLDASISPGDLRTSQLKKALALEGVPRSHWSALNKRDLVALIQRRRMQRVETALGQLSLQHRNKQVLCCFARLGTDLVIAVSAFLPCLDVAHLASCNVFLSLRLSLGLKRVHTPGLVALKRASWNERKGTMHEFKALLLRASHMQCITIERCRFLLFVIPWFPKSLTRLTLSLSAYMNGRAVFDALREMRSLVYVNVTLHRETPFGVPYERDDERAKAKDASITFSWPCLTYLQIDNIGYDARVSSLFPILSGCPALETLILSGAPARHRAHSDLVDALVGLKALRTLTLPRLFPALTRSLASLRALTDVSLPLGCRHATDFSMLPSGLRRLDCPCDLTTGRSGDLPELQYLALSSNYSAPLVSLFCCNAVPNVKFIKLCGEFNKSPTFVPLLDHLQDAKICPCLQILVLEPMQQRMSQVVAGTCARALAVLESRRPNLLVMVQPSHLDPREGSPARSP
jgi:hypothetical protein